MHSQDRAVAEDVLLVVVVEAEGEREAHEPLEHDRAAEAGVSISTATWARREECRAAEVLVAEVALQLRNFRQVGEVASETAALVVTPVVLVASVAPAVLADLEDLVGPVESVGRAVRAESAGRVVQAASADLAGPVG